MIKDKELTNFTIKKEKKIMNKQEKTTINKSSKIKKYLGYGLFAAGILGVSYEVLAWDINAGVTAGMTPLITALTAHWGKGVALGAVTTAVISEGDMRTRAIRALIGGGAAGAVILGILATAG